MLKIGFVEAFHALTALRTEEDTACQENGTIDINANIKRYSEVLAFLEEVVRSNHTLLRELGLGKLILSSRE